MGFEIGTHLGPYIVEEFLDAGGMGEVYRARDPRLGRDVAIKVLPRGLSDQPEFRERFERETRAMSSLNHKNVCIVYDTGTFEERPYIVMELMKGRTLAAALDGSPMRAEKVLKIGIEIASALEAMHGAGIVHRDIKTANVFLTPSGDAKVLDFGIAKIALGDDTDPGRRARLTGQQNPMGTVAYMSPEQADGREVDSRSDIYSLGVVLYEMATGQPPFRGSPTAILARLGSTDPVPPPTTVNRMLPGGLDRVIRRALEKDPRIRYQTAADLIADLRRVQRDLSLGVSSPPPRASGASSSGRGLKVALMAGVVLVGGGLAFAFLPMSREAVRSVAIIPCPDDQGTEQGVYNCGVVAQRLITGLSIASPGLDVKSYTVVDDLANSITSPYAVGQELDVDAVVILRLEEVGTERTIVANVDDVRSRSYLGDHQISGGGSFDQAQLQTVAASIAEDLNPSQQLDDPIRLALERRYQDAEYKWQSRETSNLREARDILTSVIDEDPDFARAHASLAITNILLHYYASEPPSESYPAAKRAADRAIEIDNTLASAWAVRGLYYRDYERDFDLAGRELLRATDLDDGLAFALQWYAEYLTITRQFDRAGDYIRDAERAAPTDPTVKAVRGWIQLAAGETDAARGVLDRLLMLKPDDPIATWFLGQLEVVEGNYDQATITLGRAADLTGHDSRRAADLAAARALAGSPQAARVLVAEYDRAGGPLFESAILKTALGDTAGALADLREAARAERTWQIASMAVDPMLRGLHGDPEFADLLAEAGIPVMPEER